MMAAKAIPLCGDPKEIRMQMIYGVNQADQCWDFALGAEREHIWQRLREIDTRLIRLFLFDKARLTLSGIGRHLRRTSRRCSTSVLRR